MIAYIWVGLVVIGTVCGIALGNGEAVADAVKMCIRDSSYTDSLHNSSTGISRL